MRDLTMTFGMVIVTANELNGVLKSTEVDPPEVEGEEQGAYDEPQNHDGDVSFEEVEFIKDDTFNPNRERSGQLIDLLVKTREGSATKESCAQKDEER